ncbi:psilocybin cluster transcription regulator [Favolaschia claudopus]|uniref:Psilocybin cluster transcription regulator n=1 Tax=Favolaschia claudopus TaxID=2862362 RepID=A0AAW0DVC9_9AGAR
MATAAPSDPALPPASAPAAAAPLNLGTMELAQLAQLQANGSQALPGLDPAQLVSLLRNLPGVFAKQLADGTLKEDAAQTLSHLSHLAQDGTGPGGYRVSDPGPSSHPHGPPSTVGHLTVPSQQILTAPAAEDENDVDDGEYVDKPEEPPVRKPTGGGKGRGRGGAAMGSEEWARQRKDNHKEVERRRRGNINEGINELARIVPSGSGEKAKGAILSRAVQYIHHLKENEARNIEKWTLEKLLMDQAMGDLQVQLDSMRKMWDEERIQHQRLKQELEALRGEGKAAPTGEKRASPESSEAEGGENKRQRTE